MLRLRGERRLRLLVVADVVRLACGYVSVMLGGDYFWE